MRNGDPSRRKGSWTMKGILDGGRLVAQVAVPLFAPVLDSSLTGDGLVFSHDVQNPPKLPFAITFPNGG
jgi:hypothetical protein